MVRTIGFRLIGWGVSALSKHTTKTKGKHKKISAEEHKKKLAQAAHKNLARSVFRLSGFTRFREFSDKEFTFLGQKSDFDDIYLYENVLICVEYTISQSSSISAHLKPKKIVYDKVQENSAVFSEFLCGMSDDLKTSIRNNYIYDEVVVRIVYCSLNAIEPQLKENVPNPVFLDYPELRYFKNLTDCIKNTARHELFAFLGISPNELGMGGHRRRANTKQYLSWSVTS